MPLGVIARVLVRDRRDDGFRKESPGDSVRKGAPIIAAVPGHTVAEFRIGSRGHGLAGDDRRPGESRIVHAIVKSECEFPARVQPLNLSVGADGGKIGSDPHHAFGLLAFDGLFFFLFFTFT